MNSKQIKSWTIPSMVLLGLVLSVTSSPTPVLHSNNQPLVDGNQLASDSQPQPQSQQRQQQQIPLATAREGQTAEFHFKPNPNPNYNTNNNGQFNQAMEYSQGQHYAGRDVTVLSAPAAPASSSSSPFFALSSSGNFELSTFLSKWFWCLTLPVISLAVLVFLVRYFFPSASFGGLYHKIRGSAAARSIDLDRVTRAVYEGINSYGKWAGLDLKEFEPTEHLEDHPKSKKSH